MGGIELFQGGRETVVKAMHSLHVPLLQDSKEDEIPETLIKSTIVKNIQGGAI